ncbi:MAG: AbrB/MazE/SpoVT family DNA-binding domain-containing protein [Candidatus Sabulitectum sp.]|nr:AbrB/MazE/SpoVT family DNA-binding domain-containing protein [Candidatus Sabulitectum sp.]
MNYRFISHCALLLKLTFLKPVIEQCGFQAEVEIEVHDHHLIIRSADHPRAGWGKSFAAMSRNEDDNLLDQVAEPGGDWDTEEWEW